MNLVLHALAAFFGTVAFSILFGTPRKYYNCCGFIGMAGWIIYCLLTWNSVNAEFAIFFATSAVVFTSRMAAVDRKCPATVFVITGIFPLVPGGGIYWTSYYIVTEQIRKASETGFAALRSAFMIVLGIVVMLEVPEKFFRHRQDAS